MSVFEKLAFKLVTVPAKWIKAKEQYCAKHLLRQSAYTDLFNFEFG